MNKRTHRLGRMLAVHHPDFEPNGLGIRPASNDEAVGMMKMAVVILVVDIVFGLGWLILH